MFVCVSKTQTKASLPDFFFLRQLLLFFPPDVLSETVWRKSFVQRYQTLYHLPEGPGGGGGGGGGQSDNILTSANGHRNYSLTLLKANVLNQRPDVCFCPPPVYQTTDPGRHRGDAGHGALTRRLLPSFCVLLFPVCTAASPPQILLVNSGALSSPPPAPSRTHLPIRH